jgi:hypothetical protein
MTRAPETRSAALWVALGLALLLLLALPARAERSWQEIARETEIVRGNIVQAEGIVAKSEQAVQAALTKVQNAERFEGPHWVELDQAMTAYTQTFSQQVKVIDNQVKTLLRLNPSADLPGLNLSPPQFKPAVKGMEAVRDDLKRAVLRARRFKAERQSDRAKVNLEMYQRTEDQAVDLGLNFAGVPIGSDGSINYGDIVASLLPLPAQMINTGVGLTFGLYFYADEMKSGVMQIKTFADQIAFADQAIGAAEASLRSAEQGLQFLNGYWLKKEEAIKELYAARNGWASAAGASRQELKKEQQQDFQKEVDRPRYPASNTYFEPPLLASEVEPEAKAIIRELESAAQAAMQGGDPDAYAAILNARLGDHRGKLDAARAVTGRARTAANAAATVLYNELGESGRAYEAAVRGRCWCERGVFEAAYAALTASQAASWARYRPFDLALRAAERAEARLWMIGSLVSEGANSLYGLLWSFGQTANAGLNQQFNQSLDSFREVSADMAVLGGALPDSYSVDAINNYLGGLDERVASSLRWGADPAGLRSELLAYAESVRALGERARTTAPEYRRAALAAQQAAKELGSALKASLAKDALLIASVWDSSLGNMNRSLWDDAPWSRGTDQRKEAIARYEAGVDEAFKVWQRADLDKVISFNYEGAARQIEERAASLEAQADIIATFRHRLLAASGRLDRVSKALLQKSAFEARTQAAQARVAEELVAGPWTGLAAALDGLQAQPQAQAIRGLATQFVPATATGMGMRGRLLVAQNLLYMAAQVQMRDYIRGRGFGAFLPVRPDDFKGLDAQWTALRPLIVQFDTLAAAERGPVLAAQKEFPDGAALQAAYQRIPAASRPLVDAAYQRYNGAAVYLNDYMTSKLTALEPLGDATRNDTLARLDDWVGQYPQRLRDWERQQAEAQALFERQMAAQREEERKRAEAAEKARREQEEAQKIAAQASTESVRKLYQDFAATYQARNLRGVLRFMTPDWRAADGSDLRDLEDILDNSFRVFNSIVFAISGLTIAPAGDGRFSVSYSATITGRINQMNLNHQETAQVEDTVILTPGGPKIQATRGGRIWLKR